MDMRITNIQKYIFIMGKIYMLKAKGKEQMLGVGEYSRKKCVGI